VSGLLRDRRNHRGLRLDIRQLGVSRQPQRLQPRGFCRIGDTLLGQLSLYQGIQRCCFLLANACTPSLRFRHSIS